MADDHVGDALSDGTPLDIQCETSGTAVDNGSGPNTIWERLTDGTYLPNAFVSTGSDSWTTGMPDCSYLDAPTAPDQQPAASNYDRSAAVIYASDHVNDVGRMLTKPDCTYYASMILFAGGLPKTRTWTDHTTDPNESVSHLFAWRNLPTKTAMSADKLMNYLTTNQLGWSSRQNIDNLIVQGGEDGDLVFYDWNSDGVMDHVAIVTDTSGTQTKVAQHTDAAFDKGWNWSQDSNDWLSVAHPDASAYLVHITY